MLTPAKLAELLALSPKTLYARVKAGTIPSIRIGGSIRFDPAVTANWLQSKMA
jgi:excisionase family DNA binding protein